MLDAPLVTLRLFLHVLAAAVWVGGQLTLAGLVPALRRAGPEAPRAAARGFNRVAWPAYAVLVLTGLWNLAAIGAGAGAQAGTLTVKLGMVVLSGVGAALHARARSRGAVALWGAVSALSGVAALFLGVALRT